jgi:RNA polymerase sigma-70 factor, ECF subfamily
MQSELELARIASGDRAAFSRLYSTTRQNFVRYATALLAGDRDGAEDAVDEAFIVIWQQSARFSGNGSAMGWMRRIVRNKAVDWIRRTRIGHVSGKGDEFALNAIADSAPNPEKLASDESDAAALRRALEVLSVEQREAVWLCYFEDKSLAEIAELCGCPENTVKTRLFHARRILRENAMIDHQV